MHLPSDAVASPNPLNYQEFGNMGVISNYSTRSSHKDPWWDQFGHPEATKGSPSTIVAMFEDAVARHPHRTAVEDEQKCQLTFLQLNGIANRLARVLFRTRGDIIPVCMDRSIDLLVTLLAVLKIGAAYTILDPDGPAERNAQIFHDSGASVILTQQRYMHIFDNALDIEQALLQATAGSNDNNLDIPIHSKDKCYIIYTSGSTGRPKGVVLTHGAASTGMAYHSLNGCDRWLLFYNPTFSAAQRTMLSTLIHGGTLIVASKEKVQTELAHLINDLSIDALGLTPSALSILHPSQVPNLRQVTLIGERIPELLVSQWAPHLELRNSYGLSECTQLNFGTRLQPGSNPRAIGRPIDTTSAFVLDPESTQLMPHGMPGELCLVGPQLGSGYLNNIQATDKVFIPNPFGKGKLYRTGDSARMTPDGSFEILGRIDFQVKINGQKVDPTEVDAALIKHPAVTASITVGASISDRTILVTGIVLGEDSQWTTVRSTLRQHAESFLPAYMVPSFWMPLAEVPRNSNGKLDLLHFKRTVESMTIDQLLGTTNASDDDDPVVDPVEIQIAEIWAEVLGMQLSSIRRQHSFVMLGGSSIQAITTIAKLATIGLQTNLRSLLGDTTLMTAASLYEKTKVSLKDPEPFSLISDVQLRKGLQSDDAIVDAYPATPLQQDLLASLAMDDDCYTYQRLWDVSDLDVPRLRASFHAVFEQSDILRTSFVPNGNTIIQVVKSDLGFPWFESSLTLEEYCRQSRTSPLTLSGPLFRIALVSGSTLVISMHHSLFDLWSHQFLYQDVAAIYHGKKPEIRAPFKRFINYLSNQDWDAKHKFWKHYLSGSEPTKLNHSPSEHTTKLSTTLPYSWKSQVRAHNLTMGAVFYTAWAVVLSKHTASYDVGFLTSLSGRDAPVPGVQTMDGPTLSMVPQRVLLDPLRSIVELVKDVGSHAMELNDHVQYGLRNALAAGSLRIDDFDTFLNILVSPEVDEVTASVFKRHGPPPHWDSSFTTLEVVDNEDSTTIRICGKMESLRLQYLLDSFIIAVKSIIQYPTHTVASIDIIGDAEGEYLKNVLSNCATLRGPTWQLLHARFEAHAKHCPNAIAIDWDATEELTYAALDSRANQLSHHLFDRGVRVGDIIPLMVDKSIDTIIAILGVLKTGAAYVPLTADNPMERNSFILRDVGAKLMIVHKKYADFAACNDIAVVVIDDIPWEDIKVPAPESSVTPDYLAYVIYTSGSTGQPKGVKVSHRAAASAITSMEVAEGRNNGEWRTLQFANYVFDASVQDIFNTLSTGGTLCMAPTEALLSDLPGAINALHVKQAIITPTVAKLITPVEVPTLQTLIVGGEPITRDIVESWATAGRQVLNVYGPTETSMVVTTKNVTPSSIVSNIGTPFSTVVAFVLEPESVRLVPYGGIGELCIAGPQLSDGYVNRPDLSAAAFVDGTALGVSKLYRTGDLARWLPGREISCLGRKDSQVKIHGHRIELGEIEVAMTKQDKIQDAAVISIDIGGKPSLVAFCVLKSADKPSTSPTIWCPQDHIDEFSQLHQGLVSLGLTPYMIPNFVVPIGDLPKLPSRKVDRKALRRLVEDMDHSLLRQYILSSTGAKHNIVPVETSMEVELERLFSEILQLPTSEIGREANFMVLGGDSVMAIMLSSSMRKAGLLLSVKQILKLATLKDMAAVVQMVEDSDLKVEREFTIPEDVRRKVESEGLDWQQDVEYGESCKRYNCVLNPDTNSKSVSVSTWSGRICSPGCSRRTDVDTDRDSSYAPRNRSRRLASRYNAANSSQ
jgi:amino acid adenylation domain-containing protein